MFEAINFTHCKHVFGGFSWQKKEKWYYSKICRKQYKRYGWIKQWLDSPLDWYNQRFFWQRVAIIPRFDNAQLHPLSFENEWTKRSPTYYEKHSKMLRQPLYIRWLRSNGEIPHHWMSRLEHEPYNSIPLQRLPTRYGLPLLERSEPIGQKRNPPTGWLGRKFQMVR